MPKEINKSKPGFVTTSALEKKIDSLKSYNKKEFFPKAAGNRLEEKIDSIAERGIVVSGNKKDNTLGTDVNLYVFLTLFFILAGITFYFLSVIQSLKNTIKDLYRSINKLDRNEKPKHQPTSPDIFNPRFKEIQNKLEDLESNIDLIKNQIFEIELIVKEGGNRETPNPPIETERPKQQTKFFEPTVLHKSAAGLSVFETFEEVRMYEVFQLNINSDGKNGTFFFDESLVRGKNDVATELRKLFPFAEYGGSGTLSNFKTTKKGVARLVSGNQWEVVEKAKIEIS